MRAGAVISMGAVALAGCAEETERQKAFGELKIQQLSSDRFAVSVEALNTDGYELARCLAAAYTATQRDEEGIALYPFFVRDGGKITDEFRLIDGERQQTTRGVQTYAFAVPEKYTPGDHDGRDVMAVDLQLATCEKQGLPTTLGDGA